MYKNLLLHEVKLCNQLITTLRCDLEGIELYLRGDELASRDSHVVETLDVLLREQVPYKWMLGGMATSRKRSLTEFLRCLLLKYHHIKDLVVVRRGVAPPIIPLQNLFDPVHMLSSALWQYSRQNNIPLNKLQIHLIPLKVIPSKAAVSGGVYVTGFSLRGGKLSEHMHLEEEFSREYETKMPAFTLVVSQKHGIDSEQVRSEL